MIPTRGFVVSLAFVLAGPAYSQTPRRLSLTPDLRIGAQAIGATRDAVVALAPDGHLVVAPKYGGMPMIGFDSLGNRLPWKVPLGGRDEAEILLPARVGFIAGTSTMWVSDNGYGQVALVDASGKVFKSIENPSWLHPTWAERRKYPVFANSQAVALYRDESMLLLPGRERALLDTPGYDRSGQHLLRASWTGSIQRSVAMLPDIQDAVAFHAKGCEHVTLIPFGMHSAWAVSADGSRLVVVRPGMSVSDSGTVRVTAVGERGDTVYSRVIAQPSVRVPKDAVDNLLAGQRACGVLSADAVRDSVSRRVTAFKSFVVGVMVGRDQTTWVAFRPVADTATQRDVVALDDRGETIGVLTVPTNQVIVGADRGHLWTMEGGRNRAPVAIVRYRLDATPAQPPRSGRAGTSPTRSPSQR